MQDRTSLLKTHYDHVREGGDKIHSLVKQNQELFKATEDRNIWALYIKYLDDIVLDGLFRCVEFSLQYFLDNTDCERDLPPLLLAKMELQAPNVVFNPSLYQEDQHGFYSMVEELLDDIFNFASLVSRVANNKDTADYLTEVEELADLLDMREEIMSRVSAAVQKANKHCSIFDQYSYLWIDDRQEFMRQFLLYGHMLTTEELEEGDEEGLTINPPTLSQFKDQVDSYEKVYTEVLKFEVRKT